MNSLQVKIRLAAALICFSGLACGADDFSKVSRPDIEVVESLITDSVIVGFEWVDMPKNRILLIRNRDHLCALEYLSFSRGRDGKNPEVPVSEEEYFDAEARLMRLPDGKIKRVRPRSRPSLGLEKVVYIPDLHQIRCGRARLIWSYPTGTGIWDYDHETELAPTSASSFDEAKRLVPSELRWFKSSRAHPQPWQVIKLSDLDTSR